MTRISRSLLTQRRDADVARGATTPCRHDAAANPAGFAARPSPRAAPYQCGTVDRCRKKVNACADLQTTIISPVLTKRRQGGTQVLLATTKVPSVEALLNSL